MPGRSPPLYYTLTLIAMQGHQTKSESNMVVITYLVVMCVAVRRALFEFDTLRFMMPWRVECPTMCVCVFFPFILDINGRTSRGHTGGRSHRISHPPSFCGACLNFSREKDSAILFPRRP